MKSKFHCFGILLIGFACLWAPAGRAATTWYVATNGTGEGVNGWADATNSLTGTVAASTAGDIVLVSNGTFQLTGQLIVNKAITIQSLAGQEQTEIRGAFPTTVFRCLYIGGGAIVDGFTIANGYAKESTDGAGVYIISGILQHSRVTSNYLETPALNSQSGGAGIYMAGGTVSNCLIDGNILTNLATHSAAGGGGVHLNSANALLIDSEIRNNLSTNPATLSRGNGGGLALRRGIISGCLIVSNYASGSGGGFSMNGGAGLMINCTNAYNYTINYGAGGNIGSYAPVDVYVFSNSVFLNNTAMKHGGGLNFASESAFYKCRFVGNQTAEYGGGALVHTNAEFFDCVFQSNISHNNTVTYGGAMYIWAGATGRIAHCVFEGNSATSATAAAYGGAIADTSADVSWLVENCAFRGNSAYSGSDWAAGGGIYSRSSNLRLRNCLIDNNTAIGADATYGGVGGGLSFYQSASMNVIESCTIAGNYAKLSGGGVYYRSTSGDTTINSIVYDNTNESGADNWKFASADQKTNVSYTCTPDADASWGAGCRSGAPAFAAPAEANYRLAAGSPCIDTGTKQPWMDGEYDLDGRARLDRFTGLTDMGCFEHIHGGLMFMLR